MDNAIITIVIRDRGSIIAAVTILLGHKVSVLDMAQNIIDGFFNMMLIEDCSDFGIPFDDLLDGLKTLGEGIGVKVCAQREEIFTSMHRVWGGPNSAGSWAAARSCPSIPAPVLTSLIGADTSRRLFTVSRIERARGVQRPPWNPSCRQAS